MALAYDMHGNRNDVARHTIAVVLAGGSGTRLGELTRWHAKPALPFGGQYRNIDFALSNCVNSGVRRVGVLTQYKAHSLIQHLKLGWSFLRPEFDEFVELWPAQQRDGHRWYDGTADAVYQNMDLIMQHAPDYVLVLAGDHVYKMDYRPMIEAHVASGAHVTVGCVEVPVAEATAFGVMAVDGANRVVEFAEKPERPRAIPGRSGIALGSMGIYVFDREFLFDALIEDASRPSSGHDFGHNLLPSMVRNNRVVAYPLRDERTGRPGYWRDVGTVDSYWQANMDLLDDAPPFEVHDRDWPIWTHQLPRPPARFVRDGAARRSIVAAGSVVEGTVDRSILFADSAVGRGTTLRGSIVLPNARIGRHCRLSNVIVDSGCDIPDDTVIGEDPGRDAALYDVSPGGIALVTAQQLALRVALGERRAAA